MEPSLTRRFLDVNVPLYADGKKHHYRESCRWVMTDIAEGRLEVAGTATIIMFAGPLEHHPRTAICCTWWITDRSLDKVRTMRCLRGRFQRFAPGISSVEHVLIESAALLERHLGLDTALRFLGEAQAFRVCWVTAGDHGKAVELLREKGLRGLSLVDCVSFLVMRRLGVGRALAFDDDFAHEGFSVYED